MGISRRDLLKKGSILGLLAPFFGGKAPKAEAKTESVQVLPKGAPVPPKVKTVTINSNLIRYRLDLGRKISIFSPIEDIRNWGIDQVDETTRREISSFEEANTPASFDIEIEYESEGELTCFENYTCQEGDLQWTVNEDNNPSNGLKYDSLDFNKTQLVGTNGLDYNLHIAIDKTTTIDIKAVLQSRSYTFDGIQGV